MSAGSINAFREQSAVGQVDNAPADPAELIEQLGIARTGDNRLFVQDLGSDHAAAITRTIGGKTALAQGADIRTDAPNHPEASQNERDKMIGEWLSTKPNATVDDLAKFHANGL